MGLGRREFLRLAGLALAGLAIDPLASVAINDNVYVNKKLGILFEKPNSWGFIAVKDFGKLKSQQLLADEMEAYKEEIFEDLGDPICLVTKYFQGKPENQGIFSPTISLHITPKEELEDLEYDSFEELMELSAYGTSLILKDYQVLKKYNPYYISGSKFYEFDASYLFEHTDLKEPLKVELKVLKTEHNGLYYDFNCHQSKAQNQIADKEFEAFKRSIKLI